MIGTYQDVSKIEEFKKIIISNNTSNDDQILHDFILNLKSQSSVNTQRIAATYKSFQNLTESYN